MLRSTLQSPHVKINSHLDNFAQACTALSVFLHVCGEQQCSYLDTTRGKINIFSILISSSPGNWKYFTSCKRSKSM